MQKHPIFLKTISLFLTAVLCPILLCGCGKEQTPSVLDAQNYVTALLDMTCKGNCDTAVELCDIEESRAEEMKQMIADGLYSSVTEDAGTDEDLNILLCDFLTEAGKYCHYTVMPPEETADEDTSEYDLEVAVEPCKVFKDTSSILEEEILKMKRDQKALTASTSDEIRSQIFSAVFKRLTENLKNAEYESPEIISVHYGLLDQSDQIYGINDADCRKLGEKLFSTEGLE